MGLGPEFLVAILVKVADLLDGGPAEDSVVTDEGRDVTVADGVLDGRVDEVGEEGDTAVVERQLTCCTKSGEGAAEALATYFSK